MGVMSETSARTLAAGQVLLGSEGGESRILEVQPAQLLGMVQVRTEHGVLVTDPDATVRLRVDLDGESVTELAQEAVARLGAARAEAAFDEMVYEVAASVAADANNGGLDAQVRYLIETLGLFDAERCVAELWAEDTARVERA